MMKKVMYSLFALAGLLLLIQAQNRTTGYQVGDTAIDFKLKNVDGKMVAMKDFKDAKGFIVIFTCNHCPYAVANEDRIIALHKKYAAKGFPVIAINPNDVGKQPEDSFDKMIERSKSKKFPFVYLYDESQDIAKTYGAAKTPHVYLLDKNRVVKYIGAIDDSPKESSGVSKKYVEDAIEAMLKGKAIPVENTKAIGCTIKWRDA